MQWETLLSTKKLKPEAEEVSNFKEYPINEFEKDYNIIVFAGFKIRRRSFHLIRVILSEHG